MPFKVSEAMKYEELDRIIIIDKYYNPTEVALRS